MRSFPCICSCTFLGRDNIMLRGIIIVNRGPRHIHKTPINIYPAFFLCTFGPEYYVPPEERTCFLFFDTRVIGRGERADVSIKPKKSLAHSCSKK